MTTDNRTPQSPSGAGSGLTSSAASNTFLQTVSDFCRWWWAELADLLSSEGSADQKAENTAILDFEAGIVRLSRQGAPAEINLHTPYKNCETDRARSEELTFEIAKIVTAHKITRLIVNLPDIIETVISLPEAARRNLSEFIEYDIDRHVPFERSEIAMAYDYLSHEPSRQSITVRLTVCPLAHVEWVTELARGTGCRLVYLGRDTAGRTTGNLALSLPAQAAGGHHSGQKYTGLKYALSAGLFLAAFLVPFLQNKYENSQQRAAFDSINERVIQRRAELDRIQTDLAWLTTVSDQSPKALDTLRLVQDALEGEGWISYLVWQPGELQITGQTPGTTALIERLVGHPHISSVDYLSPTQVLPESGLERFQLRLLLNTTTGQPPEGQGDQT